MLRREIAEVAAPPSREDLAAFVEELTEEANALFDRTVPSAEEEVLDASLPAQLPLHAATVVVVALLC